MKPQLNSLSDIQFYLLCDEIGRKKPEWVANAITALHQGLVDSVSEARQEAAHLSTGLSRLYDAVPKNPETIKLKDAKQFAGQRLLRSSMLAGTEYLAKVRDEVEITGEVLKSL